MQFLDWFAAAATLGAGPSDYHPDTRSARVATRVETCVWEGPLVSASMKDSVTGVHDAPGVIEETKQDMLQSGVMLFGAGAGVC